MPRALLACIWLAAAPLPAASLPKVIAHRGGMASLPENTLPAFRNAMDLGVDMLEFDMNVTADDRIVLHHDSKVNPAICVPEAGSGVTPGPIRHLLLQQILRFDCGSRPPQSFPAQKSIPGLHMPTFDEFLEAVRGSQAELLGETKMSAESAGPAKFVDLICRALAKYGVERRFILQSADYRTIDEMRRRNPHVRTCLLNARRFKPDYVSLARLHKADSLMLNSDDVDAAGVARLHAAGCRVYSGTADDPARWSRYVEMNMDGILTNDPKALIAFLASVRH